MSTPVHEGRKSLRLLGEPRDVHLARAFAQRVLHDRGVGIRGDDVVAVVSEMVTNAVVPGHGPVRLDVEINRADVVIRVADSHPVVPAQRVASGEDESGRGLAIVQSLSADLWFETDEGGKTTCARVPLDTTRETGY